MCIKYVYNIYCAANILPDLEMHTSLAVPLLLILNSIVCILEKKKTPRIYALQFRRVFINIEPFQFNC